MESAFTLVIWAAIPLFYFSNRKSPINRWCTLYLTLSSVGVAKEAFLYQVVPWIQSVWGDRIEQDIYLGIYSVLTWISYSFAMPAALVMAFYFCAIDQSKPKLLSVVRRVIYIPALFLSVIYSPLSFRAYQLENQAFWIVYSLYNLLFGVVVAGIMLQGIHAETSKKIKFQKILLGIAILPPMTYCLITIFIIHPLGLSNLFKLWRWNIVIVCLCILFSIYMVFKSGFMGLKLSVHTYNWDSHMDLLSKGAEYTSHMLKNQTSKMELCIEQLHTQFENGDPPEELAILTRSISTLKNYIDKIKRHSQTIRLVEEPCRLTELLSDAIPATLNGQSGITAYVAIPDTVFWVCDRGHMTEVFSNIIINAIEAMRGSGTIEITAEMVKSEYILHISDTGVGIRGETLPNIFTPYFTTKNTEKNFGLGLAYCKNVVIKHGGRISAQSKPNEGTVVTIAFPAKRVAVSGTDV